MATKLQKLLRNPALLYVIALISSVQFVFYLTSANFAAAELMAVIGIVARAFTANMTIVLGVAIIVTAIYQRTSHTVEGMEEGKDTSDTDDKKPTTNSSTKTVQASSAKDAVRKIKAAKDKACEEWDAEGKCIKPINHNEATVPTVDKKKNIASAVKNIASQLGGKGASKMSGDTQTLIRQQKTLLEAMDKVKPMMDQAASLVDSLNLNFGKTGALSDTIAALSGSMGK
jgi:hypothetical protein